MPLHVCFPSPSQPDLPQHTTLVHMLPTYLPTLAICACARRCFCLACRRVARTCACKMSVPVTPQGATGRRAWLLANTCVHQMTVLWLSVGYLRAGGALSCPSFGEWRRPLSLCFVILSSFLSLPCTWSASYNRSTVVKIRVAHAPTRDHGWREGARALHARGCCLLEAPSFIACALPSPSCFWHASLLRTR
jgi:hypothetical protein